jgi:hypothetical protein
MGALANPAVVWTPPFSSNVARAILEDIVAQDERLFILMKSRRLLLFA